MKYGIKFPVNEVQFGKSVHMLDLCAYLDEQNRIHYKGYTKQTDAKRYLNPRSFHPKFVFNSIPFSQILRTLRNNSKEETKVNEIEQVLKDFEHSGYSRQELNKWKEKAIEKHRSAEHPPTNAQEEDTLIFPVHYFDGIADFKTMVYSLKNEITDLIGDNRVMFAMKKRSSVGNMLVRNKKNQSLAPHFRKPKVQCKRVHPMPIEQHERKIRYKRKLHHRSPACELQIQERHLYVDLQTMWGKRNVFRTYHPGKSQADHWT